MSTALGAQLLTEPFHTFDHPLVVYNIQNASSYSSLTKQLLDFACVTMFLYVFTWVTASGIFSLWHKTQCTDSIYAYLLRGLCYI